MSIGILLLQIAIYFELLNIPCSSFDLHDGCNNKAIYPRKQEYKLSSLNIGYCIQNTQLITIDIQTWIHQQITQIELER